MILGVFRPHLREWRKQRGRPVPQIIFNVSDHYFVACSTNYKTSAKQKIEKVQCGIADKNMRKQFASSMTSKFKQLLKGF